MILTPLNIQVAIIKAFYALAKKSVKYYTGLALGKNNTCLSKEIRLLRSYIDILRNFEIVGSTITCNCCVEGDYTVLLNELSEFTEARIQFNCNSTGDMFFDNQQYPFTYGYSDVTSTLVIRFDNLFDEEDVNTILTLQDLTFESNCSFEPNTVSPIEVAEFAVTGTPVTVNYVNPLDVQIFDWDGELFVTNETVTPVTQNIPAENLSSPTTIVTDWNDEHHPTNNGWLLNYSSANETYTMLTPFDGIDYATTYAAVFQQYEGGVDSNITFENVITTPWVTEGSPAYTELDIPNTFVGKHAALATVTPSLDPFIDTPAQATTTLLIPTDIFDNPGIKASLTLIVDDSFFKCQSNYQYIDNPVGPSFLANWSIAPTALSPFLTIEEAITYINDNLLLGYSLELLNTTTQTYSISSPAIMVNPFLTWNSFTAGDIIDAKLTSSYYSTSDIIGTYTVILGDTSEDIANGLIADIISQGIYLGTVTTDISGYLYFIAPAGTGSSWNRVYNIEVDLNTSYGYADIFNYGNNLIENVYTLSSTAPFVGVSYNSMSSWGPFGYTNFSGGTNSSQQVSIDITDTIDGLIYSIEPNNFTSIDDFVTAFNIASTTQAAITGIAGLYTQVEFTAPVSDTNNIIYNGQTLSFEFNKEATASNTYLGGVDTTEGIYTITMYDPSNVFAFTFENITPTNYSDLQALVDNINSNLDNVYFIASIVNNEIVLTTILESDYYNNYSVYLTYDYTSVVYDDYTSNQSFFAGGVNQVSNPFAISDDIVGAIFSQTLNNFDYPNGVTDLVVDFNDNNGLGYTAQVVGNGPIVPEVLADATAVINTSSVLANNSIIVRINGVNIGTYFVPAVLPSSAVLITGISNAINNSFNFNGSSQLIPDSITPNGIVVTAPPNTGEGYNTTSMLITRYQYTNPTVTFQFITGASSGDSFYITIGTINSLPTYTAIGSKTIAALATEYAALINSTTSTNGGYTALSPFAGVLIIKSPLYTGNSGNGVTAYFINVGGNVKVSSPVLQFQGGITTPTLLEDATFSGGKNALTTTTVRFFPPLFSGTSNWLNNNNYMYYNYDSFYYSTDNQYLYGIDTTEGKLFLELSNFPGGGTDTLYMDLTNVNYASTQELIDTINNATSTNLDFSASLASNNITIHSPDFSFNYYNDSYIEIAYTYYSPQYSTYNYDSQLVINGGVIGVNPTLVTYSGTFQSGNIGTFITDNPCTPTVVTETCLTNNQVSKIIQHINKLVK